VTIKQLLWLKLVLLLYK